MLWSITGGAVASFRTNVRLQKTQMQMLWSPGLQVSMIVLLALHQPKSAL